MSTALVAKLFLNIKNKELAFKKCSWSQFMLNKFFDQSMKLFAKNKINTLSTNFTKWSNKLKQFVGKFPTNCLSVFDHFVGLVLQALTLNSDE